MTAALAISACSGSDSSESGADTEERARAARAVSLYDGGQNAGGETAVGESTYTEGSKLIRTDESLVALGNEMFGDRVSLYNGALEFVQQDMNIPGNSALPVGVGRRHTVPISVQTVSGAYNSGQFGDWDLEIPHMHGVFSRLKGWVVEGTTSAGSVNRCSSYRQPPTVSGQQGGSFSPDEYWHGTFLYVPGSGSQEVLRRSAGISITDGGTFPLTTKDRWVIRCGVNLRNDTGEGFIAISPDGTRYTFDVMISRSYANVIKGTPGSAGRTGAAVEPDRRLANDPTPQVMAGAYFLKRKENWILPSEVRDRHGNKVTYNYDASWRLSSIVSEEVSGSTRRVDIGYANAGGLISTVSSGGRTWTYSYRTTPAGPVLSGILLPDGSRWTFNLDSFTNGLDLMISGPSDCEGWGELEGSSYTGTMTHPSGATGSFTVKGTRHGRTFVERYCRDSMGWPDGSAAYPLYLDRFSIIAKSISGPGLPVNANGSPKTSWSYAYSPGIGCTVGYLGCDANSPTTKTVTVTNPDGDQTRYTFGIRFRVDEGQLLKTEEAFGTAYVKTTERRYADPATGGPWPDPIGSSIQRRGNGELASRHAPERYKKITQQGVDFLWQSEAFDEFGKPARVTKQGPSGTKDERQTYSHNTAKWVLGQPLRTWLQVPNVGELEIERHDYDATTANKLASYSFGLKKQSFTYYGDGTLATKADGLGNTTQYFDYKRGLARSVVYADSATESATVDDWGQVLSVTNAASTTTSYGYDGMGRLSAITYPTGDAVAYNGTSITYEQRGTTEYGLAPNHWVQTTATGNARTERYFDAQWRPLMTRSWDIANAGGTRRVKIMRYDGNGRKTFESYPQRDIGLVTDNVAGTTTTYDALGRVSQTVASSELGNLTTTTQYLAGFQRQVTNPRGYATTHAFQAFDEPKEEGITAISAPEGVSVTINRDLLGKATSITRAGGGKSLTRSYVYDGYQRLCKTIEPESGATVVAYHGASDLVAWRASGQSLSSINSCDQASVPAAKQISYSYDTRNRLTGTTYGDGSQNITRSYTPDGLLKQIVANHASNPVTWNYGYNNRRLLVREGYAWWQGATYQDGAWSFYYDINAQGHVSGLTDPWGAMPYEPNALGEPTRVGGYVTGVTYHPTGAVAGYTLGNGVVHSSTLNARGLPLRFSYSGIAQDAYAYDANGNVTAITDEFEGVNNRTMPLYDGLDRLRQANGPWGSGSYAYDALDNLVSSTVGARSLNHNIDSATNLLTSLSGSQNMAIGYDANGNITQRGSQGFTFDIGNRMTSAPNKIYNIIYDGHGRRNLAWFNAGGYMHQAYTRDGKLRFAYRAGEGHTRHVYLGDKLIAEYSESVGANVYSHTDALGSPIARSNSGGGLINRTRYEPYGATVAGSTNPTKIGFTGHVNDPETGLVYMQQRYYEPLAGRFLSVDPVTTDISSGEHFNRYAYADNGPYKFKDPDGRTPVHAIAFAVGFAIDVAAQRIIEGKSWSEVNYVDAALSGAGAALAGAAGGQLASLAMRGTITSGQAVAGTALAGGAAGAGVSAASDLLKGQTPSAAKMAIGAAGGAAGSAVGAKLANAAASTVQKMAATGGVMGGVAAATRSSTSFGSVSSVKVGTSLGQEAGKVVADTASAFTSKAAEQKLVGN